MSKSRRKQSRRRRKSSARIDAEATYVCDSCGEEIVVPVMLAPADTGQNPSWTSDKREAIEIAERLLPVSRTHWFAPADHDLHAQHPDRLAQHLIDAVADGFFSPYTEDN